MGGLLRCFGAGGLGSEVVLRLGWWFSLSESDDVDSLGSLVSVFFAVGGPCRGLLFFLGGCCSSSSCSSSNVVGSFDASLRLSAVRARLSGNARAHNCVGSSSSSSSLTGVNDRGFLLWGVTRLPLRLFSDAVGAFAKSGRLQRRLLGVPDESDVPGVACSSS